MKVSQKLSKDSKASASSSSSSSDSESDSDSSSSSSEESEKPVQKKVKPVPAVAAKEIVSVTKKRRTDEEGASVPTAIHVNTVQESVKPNGAQNGGKNKNGNEKRKMNTPFQRVKVDQITYTDERLKDNRFESRVSATYHLNYLL